MSFTVKTPLLKEVADSAVAFLRETRNGTANIEQTNAGAKVSQRAISAVGMDLKVRLAAPRLAEIEEDPPEA